MVNWKDKVLKMTFAIGLKTEILRYRTNKTFAGSTC